MAWTIEQIERTFLGYMERHGHTIIEGHSVRSPTDDVLFTTAGMHPLIPYLKGEAPGRPSPHRRAALRAHHRRRRGRRQPAPHRLRDAQQMEPRRLLQGDLDP